MAPTCYLGAQSIEELKNPDGERCCKLIERFQRGVPGADLGLTIGISHGHLDGDDPKHHLRDVRGPRHVHAEWLFAHRHLVEMDVVQTSATIDLDMIDSLTTEELEAARTWHRKVLGLDS